MGKDITIGLEPSWRPLPPRSASGSLKFPEKELVEEPQVREIPFPNPAFENRTVLVRNSNHLLPKPSENHTSVFQSPPEMVQPPKPDYFLESLKQVPSSDAKAELKFRYELLQVQLKFYREFFQGQVPLWDQLEIKKKGSFEKLTLAAVLKEQNLSITSYQRQPLKSAFAVLQEGLKFYPSAEQAVFEEGLKRTLRTSIIPKPITETPSSTLQASSFEQRMVQVARTGLPSKTLVPLTTQTTKLPPVAGFEYLEACVQYWESALKPLAHFREQVEAKQQEWIASLQNDAAYQARQAVTQSQFRLQAIQKLFQELQTAKSTGSVDEFFLKHQNTFQLLVESQKNQLDINLEKGLENIHASMLLAQQRNQAARGEFHFFGNNPPPSEAQLKQLASAEILLLEHHLTIQSVHVGLVGKEPRRYALGALSDMAKIFGGLEITPTDYEIFLHQRGLANKTGDLLTLLPQALVWKQQQDPHSDHPAETPSLATVQQVLEKSRQFVETQDRRALGRSIEAALSQVFALQREHHGKWSTHLSRAAVKVYDEALAAFYRGELDEARALFLRAQQGIHRQALKSFKKYEGYERLQRIGAMVLATAVSAGLASYVSGVVMGTEVAFGSAAWFAQQGVMASVFMPTYKIIQATAFGEVDPYWFQGREEAFKGVALDLALTYGMFLALGTIGGAYEMSFAKAGVENFSRSMKLIYGGGSLGLQFTGMMEYQALEMELRHQLETGEPLSSDHWDQFFSPSNLVEGLAFLLALKGSHALLPSFLHSVNKLQNWWKSQETKYVGSGWVVLPANPLRFLWESVKLSLHRPRFVHPGNRKESLSMVLRQKLIPTKLQKMALEPNKKVVMKEYLRIREALRRLANGETPNRLEQIETKLISALIRKVEKGNPQAAKELIGQEILKALEKTAKLLKMMDGVPGTLEQKVSWIVTAVEHLKLPPSQAVLELTLAIQRIPIQDLARRYELFRDVMEVVKKEDAAIVIESLPEIIKSLTEDGWTHKNYGSVVVEQIGALHLSQLKQPMHTLSQAIRRGLFLQEKQSSVVYLDRFMTVAPPTFFRGASNTQNTPLTP